MKDALLLLMTPNMSLKKWDAKGQLSRELGFYSDFIKKANLKLIIYSYGRDDKKYLANYPQFEVLEMPNWIPKGIPYRVQNLIYHLVSLLIYRKYFKSALIAKTNQFAAAQFGVLLKLVYQIPLVVRMGFYYSHFKKISFKRRVEEKIVFRKADLILTTSFEAAAFIEKTYQINSKKILSMCNTIDLNRFKPVEMQKEYDLIFIGRLEKGKNIKFLLDVVSDTNYKTLIVGKGSLDYLVKDAVQQYHNIEWRERVDNAELPLYYNKSRCFILLSHLEGNPKVLLEAMACGLPVIGTKVPGTRECIVQGSNGFLVNMDVNEVKSRISELLSSPDQMSAVGAHARAWVANRSDMDKNITTEAEFYFNYLREPNVLYS